MLRSSSVSRSLAGFTFILFMVQVVYANESGREMKRCPYNPLSDIGTRQGFCGDQIHQMVKLLCRTKKRATEPADSSDPLQDDTPLMSGDIPRVSSLAELGSSDGLFLPRQEAMSFLDTRRVKRRVISTKDGMFFTGILCECCYHRCSPNEMMQYCHGDTRSLAIPHALPAKHRPVLMRSLAEGHEREAVEDILGDGFIEN